MGVECSLASSVVGRLDDAHVSKPCLIEITTLLCGDCLFSTAASTPRTDVPRSRLCRWPARWIGFFSPSYMGKKTNSSSWPSDCGPWFSMNTWGIATGRAKPRTLNICRAWDVNFFLSFWNFVFLIVMQVNRIMVDTAQTNAAAALRSYNLQPRLGRWIHRRYLGKGVRMRRYGCAIQWVMNDRVCFEGADEPRSPIQIPRPTYSHIRVMY